MNIQIDPFDPSSIDKAIKQLEDYQKKLEKKADEVAARLASVGATSVSLGFLRAIYDGKKDFDITVEKQGDGQYSIIASGESVLFIEFGAGVTYGNGHPENGKFGMGPGTWPYPHSNKYRGVIYPNWQNPSGWYLPKEAGGGHTFGNAPAMPMYNTEQELKKEIERVVREVLSSD